jgi:hypothetical protein
MRSRAEYVERLMGRLWERRDEHALRIVGVRYEAKCRGWPLTPPEWNYVSREYERMAVLDDEIAGWARMIGQRPWPRRNVLGTINHWPPW